MSTGKCSAGTDGQIPRFTAASECPLGQSPNGAADPHPPFGLEKSAYMTDSRFSRQDAV